MLRDMAISVDTFFLNSDAQGTLQAQIQDAFFSFDWEGTALQEEFEKSNEGQFLQMNYKEFWDVIRKIDTANGVSYACS